MNKRKISIITILLLLFNSLTVYADYYQLDNSSYYTTKEEQDIFNTKLGDIGNPLDWLYNLRSYTVIKENKDGSNSYYPTPNLQMLGRNLVSHGVTQGFSYQPEKREKDLSGRIHLNQALYYGEYPVTVMTMNQIVPSNFFDGIWRGIKSLFGASFVDAPNIDTLNSLTSMNMDYIERESKLVDILATPLLNYHNQLNKNAWDTGVKGFKNEYKDPSIKETAERNISLLRYGDKYGEDAYKSVVTIRDDYYTTDKYRYKSLSGLLNGENGYSLSVEGKNSFNEFIKTHHIGIENKSIEEIEKSGEFNFTYFKYPVSEVITEDMNKVISVYEENKKKIDEYNAFINKFNSYGEHSVKQCLIGSKEPEKCSNDKFGSSTTLYVGNVHILSNAFELLENKSSLSKEDVIMYLEKIRAFTGPYYREVFGNLLTEIVYYYKEAYKTDLVFEEKILRPLPYDWSSMKGTDKDTFTVSDPRNDLYKNHLLGAVVSSLNVVNFNVLFYFRLQPFLIDAVGWINDLTIMFNNMIDFTILEQYGLSPTSLWDNGLVTVALICLVLFIMFKTVTMFFALLKGKSKLSRLFVLVFIVMLEMGLFTYLSNNKDTVWQRFKEPISYIMNLGEMTFVNSDENFDYIVEKGSDIYALPYYDAWSIYNVGYSLKDPQNYIDVNSGKAEVKDIFVPKLKADKEIKHWAMLLANSFDYNGQSNSVMALKDKDGNLINGATINNNAYRVVDHFLAPRVNITTENGVKKVSVEHNENFNGQFQTKFFEIFTRILLSLINCLLVFIKLLLFFHFWFNLYIFIYTVIKSKLRDRMKWKYILHKIFIPLGYMVLIGMINATLITIVMKIDNVLISVLVQLGFLYCFKFGLLN